MTCPDAYLPSLRTGGRTRLCSQNLTGWESRRRLLVQTRHMTYVKSITNIGPLSEILGPTKFERPPTVVLVPGPPRSVLAYAKPALRAHLHVHLFFPLYDVHWDILLGIIGYLGRNPSLA